MKKINKRQNPNPSVPTGRLPLTREISNSGFTLIEVLVVVGVVMVIMLSISGVMTGVFSSQDKNKADDKIDQSGTWVLSELKKIILNANSGEDSFVCSAEGVSSIEIVSIKDAERTKISCQGNAIDGFKIASHSATRDVTVYLFEKNKDLELFDCNTFVSCSTLPSLQLSNVNFNFKLKAGNESLSSGTTRAFSIDVTLRN